jgi:hypothetical protein
LQVAKQRQSAQDEDHDRQENIAAAERLLALGTQAVFSGMLAAIAGATVWTHVRSQSSAILAGRRLVIFGYLGPPPRRPIFPRLPVISGHDARLTAVAVDAAVRLAKQRAARETAIDRFALANVATHVSYLLSPVSF